MKLKLNALLTAALLSSAAISANALSVVASPAGTGINLVSNACDPGLTTSGAFTVEGCLQNLHSAVVSLTSNENLVISGGQATLDSADGTFTQLQIMTEPGTSLTSVIFNIDATADGFVTFSDSDETSVAFALNANGQNFFTITDVSGFLSFTTTVEVADVKQIRLNAVGVIPEPETYALMLAGLGALGFVARRRKAVR